MAALRRSTEQLPQKLDRPADLRQGIQDSHAPQAFGLGQGDRRQYTALGSNALPLSLFPIQQRLASKLGRRPG